MRRLQILMDPELDDTLERLAKRRGMSKSALIRELVREGVKPLPPLTEDPIWEMLGVDDYEPVDIDEVVYGHVERAMRAFGRSRSSAVPRVRRSQRGTRRQRT